MGMSPVTGVLPTAGSFTRFRCWARFSDRPAKCVGQPLVTQDKNDASVMEGTYIVRPLCLQLQSQARPGP